MDKPVLLIDNFDSFTHMLADYVKQCGVECVIVRNDEPVLLQLNATDFLALIISPGPETPVEAGLLMKVLPAFIEKIPVLGICLGHQAIGMHYGAALQKAKQPRHGKVDEHQHSINPIFKGVPVRFQAARYHSLILNDLPACLETICSAQGEIMGLAHRHFPVWGLQFHPESCETPHGLVMIKNFIAAAKKIAQI